jgi:glycosyl-4,4'-diaponeurosporenoate acyltransferase
MNELRIIHFATPWTILLDIAIWFVIHIAVVVVMASLPLRHFDPRSWLYRERGWERGGELYEHVFRVRAWKHRLPDGAEIIPWRSFPKRHLERKTTEYFERFAEETCRAELTHLLTMIWAPFFFFWNPVWVGWFMIVYIVAENVPLIVAQRYNRIRMLRTIERRREAGKK